jgi:hypothetical protein
MTEKVYVQIGNEKREATEQELAQMELDRIAQEDYEAELLAAEAEKENLKATANAKLLALGLTEAEVNALNA